jgi:serine/threonine-protein kinase
VTTPIAEPTAAENVRAAIEKVLASGAFQTSDRLSRFLRYLAEQTLEGRADRLKEYSLGVDVLGRGESFDPRTDSIVRVEASRLRAKLSAYYRGEGASDPVQIELPRGSYSIRFRTVEQGDEGPDRRWSFQCRPATCVCLIAAMVGAWWLLASVPVSRAARPTPPSASLAVLPFVNLNHDRETEYVSDGLTAEVMAALARVPGLRVVARSSSFQFKGKNVDARQAGRELNVSAIVEGSVRRDGDRWVLTVELVNTDDGFQLWSRTYEPRAEELSAVQSQVANDVSRALRVPLQIEGGGLGWKKRTSNAEAYNLVLRARYVDPTSTDTAAARIAYFKQAAALDPGFADAWVGIADSSMRLASVGAVAPGLVLGSAREAIGRARTLDERLPDVHFLTAMLSWKYDWDWEAAERSFLRTIELDESSAPSRIFYALYLAHMGRPAEAMRQIENIRVLEPVLGTRSIEAAVYYFSRDYDRTIRHCSARLTEVPDMAALYYWMGRAYASKGNLAEALKNLEKSYTMQGHMDGRGFGMLGRLYGDAGRHDDARRLLATIMTKANDRWVSPLSVSQIYLGLGDRDKAMEWIERGVHDRDAAVVTLKVEPAYDALRDDPRFVALLRRLKF